MKKFPGKIEVMDIHLLSPWQQTTSANPGAVDGSSAYGSWGANCLDETKFLSDYYKRNRSRV